MKIEKHPLFVQVIDLALKGESDILRNLSTTNERPIGTGLADLDNLLTSFRNISHSVKQINNEIDNDDHYDALLEIKCEELLEKLNKYKEKNNDSTNTTI